MRKTLLFTVLFVFLFVNSALAAFDIGGFKLIGKSQSSVHNLYSYTTGDTKATIMTADYFDNVAPYTLIEGDLILVTIDNDSSISSMQLVVSDVTSGVVTVTDSSPKDINNAGATATVTLTAADCGGVFVNNTQATTYNLPADPTGCPFTFVVGSNYQMNVDPNGTDQIINKTSDSGYYYWADALGETLTIQGISTSQWAVINEVGTWTDGGAGP